MRKAVCTPYFRSFVPTLRVGLKGGWMTDDADGENEGKAATVWKNGVGRCVRVFGDASGRESWVGGGLGEGGCVRRS
jgi:hypothetical protein